MRACTRTDPHRCTIGAHSPQPSCSHCGAPDPIRGDGGMALACRRCVASLARIAAEPYSVPETVRERLLADALDVVGIRDGRWHWSSQWPSTGDLRTLTGRTA